MIFGRVVLSLIVICGEDQLAARKPLFNQRIPFTQTDTGEIPGSIESLETFFNPVKDQKHIYVHTYSPDELRHRDFGKPRTALKAYKNGHNKISVWQYANWLKVVRVQKGRIVKIEKIGKYEGFVLDIDNHHCQSIEEMIDFIKKNEIPAPSLVVQTFTSNFHIVYLAPRGYWTNQRKKQLAYWFAGEKEKLPSASEEMTKGERQIIAPSKIDLNYLQQMLNDDVYCKFRVPGSVNCKTIKDYSSSKVYTRKYFTCKGWANQNYDKDDPLGNNYKSVKKDIKSNAQPKAFWEKHIDDVYKKIRLHMPDKTAKKWAEYICKNLTRIKKGKMVISQDHAAKELNISQMSASRHLKILIEKGFLDIKQEYMYVPGKKGAGRARVYKMGNVLSEILGISKRANIGKNAGNYDILKKYVSGNTWLHFLSDIRYLYKQGCTEAQVVYLIEKKMKNKARKQYRGMLEIQKAYRQWHAKNVNNELRFFIKRPERPNIDVYKIALQL